MSRDFNVHCETCNDTHSFNDANQEKVMHVFIKHAKAIAALKPLLDDPDLWWPVDLHTSYGNIDVDWFYTHQDHKLVVIDEYGQIWDGRPRKY